MACFEVFSASIHHLTDNFAIHYALADPEKSQELKDFVKNIVVQEHNDIVQMQRSEIASLQSEVRRLHDIHAAEVQRLHGAHAEEVLRLHSEYTLKLRNALGVV